MDFVGPVVGVSGGDALSEGFQASHPGLCPASGIAAAPPLSSCAALLANVAQDRVACGRGRAVLAPALPVLADRDDGSRVVVGNGNLTGTLTGRHSRIAVSGKTTGLPVLPADPARHCLCGSIRINIDPRHSSARFCAGQLVVRWRGGCGLLITAVQPTGLAKGVLKPKTSATRPCGWHWSQLSLCGFAQCAPQEQKAKRHEPKLDPGRGKHY